MIGKHVGYYFGSKLIAAVLNLLSMALFVRFAGIEIYGGYVVAMAWAAIVYSVTLQWLRFAFFASFREETSGPQITTYLRVLAAGMIAFACLTALAVAIDLVATETAISVFVIVTGLAAYDALHEAARTRGHGPSQLALSPGRCSFLFSGLPPLSSMHRHCHYPSLSVPHIGAVRWRCSTAYQGS
jgi:hypothetical protein